jgi:hypothetical protein
MTRSRILAAAVVAVSVGWPVSAAAAHTAGYRDNPGSVLSDCAAGHYPLKGHYTIKVLQEALSRINSEGLQYTNCADVVNETIHKLELTARAVGVAGKHPRTSRASSTHAGVSASNPIKRRLKKLKTGGNLPVLLPVTGQTVTPGTVTNRGASFLSTLPTPLLIVLAALLATVLAVSARAINNLVRARRTH